jgi:hypothetical protein
MTSKILRASIEAAICMGFSVTPIRAAADGIGKTMGGSADRPSDAKARYRAAAPAYRGFRVVHQPPTAHQPCAEVAAEGRGTIQIGSCR